MGLRKNRFVNMSVAEALSLQARVSEGASVIRRPGCVIKSVEMEKNQVNQLFFKMVFQIGINSKFQYFSSGKGLHSMETPQNALLAMISSFKIITTLTMKNILPKP